MGRVSFSFLLDLIKNSDKLKSNVPKHTLKEFWVTMLVTEKKLSKKLLKWANLVLQKEPRKARFPWDLGLLFGKPIIYVLFLHNMKL